MSDQGEDDLAFFTTKVAECGNLSVMNISGAMLKLRSFRERRRFYRGYTAYFVDSGAARCVARNKVRNNIAAILRFHPMSHKLLWFLATGIVWSSAAKFESNI